LVLIPTQEFNKPVKWTELVTLDHDQDLAALSWGSSTELLTGSDSLVLWNIPTNGAAPRVKWKKKLANEVSQIAFSVDGWLIASVGKYDRLVKIWRRSSFDIDNLDFDFTYLPHPAKVVLLRWRQPFNKSQSIENTLYTVGADGVLRIWSPFDSESLQLWASIDFGGEGQAAFVVDNGDVSKAIESCVAVHQADTRDTAEVIKIGQKTPEICFVIDGHQKVLTAYTIENLGLKCAKLATITKIVDRVPFTKSVGQALRFSHRHPGITAYAPTSPSEQGLSILIHDFQGNLYHWTVDFGKLLSPTNTPRYLALKSILTGHNKSVQKITRSADGTALLTQSRFSENALWKPQLLSSGVTLRRACLIETTAGKVVRSVLMPNRDYAVTLLDSGSLVLWECHSEQATPLASDQLLTTDEPFCMFLLPESEYNHFHLVIVYNEDDILVWAIELIPRSREHTEGIMTKLGKFGLPVKDKLHKAVPVDPVGWIMTIGTSLDTFQREVLITVTSEGVLRSWTARISARRQLEWLETTTVATGEKNILIAQVSSTKKIVIANSLGTELSIWDTRNDLLEFKEQFSQDNSISDLDWTTTPDYQCVLGVGFFKEVVLYCQQRFDYTNKTPSWAPFRRVDISQYTSHRIGDSIWLKNGTFVVGAGNQLYIQDEKIDVHDDTTRHLLGSRYTSATLENINNIFDICAVINGPLPVYHPQLLVQSIFADKLEMVQYILAVLLKKLKFAPIYEPAHVADLESNLGLHPSDLLDGIHHEDMHFDQSVAHELSGWLQRVSLPFLTRHQQITLASAIEALGQMYQHTRALDSNGIKYLLGFKLYIIHRGIQDSMTMRDFNWALHSESQNLLLEVVQRPGMLWPTARDVGMAYWLRNEKLKEQFEVLGRNYFSANRDPVPCTLYYLALRRKQILLGLWRTASAHKEQQKTVKLLANDFNNPRYKSVAMKNAFALLGKHRYEYAASFFLLADSLKDAVNVIVSKMDDIGLAIAVARVYEGDNGPVFRDLAQRYIIPQANSRSDRWTISWALWMLNQKARSVEALAWGGSTQSKSFLVDDPVLCVLYRYLKRRLLKLHLDVGQPGAPQSGESEFRFVLKTASIYSRMGCDILGLDLVQSWRFIKQQGMNGVSSVKDTKSELAARPATPLDEKMAFKPAAEVAFQEPDMSAFNFGF
jgi:WD40 repeat protein